MDEDNKTNQSGELVFARDFKLAAVARLREGESGSALARELGIRRTLLYKWADQVRTKGEDDAFRTSAGRPPVDDDELSRLRRENDRLQMENEILKKAQAYFASRKR